MKGLSLQCFKRCADGRERTPAVSVMQTRLQAEMTNYRKLMRRFFLCCVTFAMSFLALPAQDVSNRSPQHGWFAGISGEVPFGLCTFSSFGSDKTRAGWGAGAYAGRRFSAVTSAEVSLAIGQTNLAARDCCVERGYWLGSDWTRYNAPVINMSGWDYSELRSVVSMLKIDARLNVNLLGFFTGAKSSPWAVEISPSLSAVGTSADLKLIATGETVRDDVSGWNFGAGALAQIRRNLGKRLEVSVFSGFTYLLGRRIDGMPEHQHNADVLWENGIRLGWRFGKGQSGTAVGQQSR